MKTCKNQRQLTNCKSRLKEKNKLNSFSLKENLVAVVKFVYFLNYKMLVGNSCTYYILFEIKNA